MISPALPAGDWMHWRGPTGNGVAESAAPIEWSDRKNLAWKTPIPGRGFSTPVVAGDRLFLTTAIPAADPAPPAADAPSRERRRGPGGGVAAHVEHQFTVMALSRTSGRILWQHTAAVARTHEGYHGRYGSFASYAPVTDGRHVWALFGSYGLYCYTVEGKPVWKKDLPAMRMRNAFGEGGSPVLSGSRLILNLDQEGGSFIAVYEKSSGKEIWRKERDEQSSWSTPLVVKVDGREQVIVSATKKVRAYDLASGDVVWECAGLGPNVIPAPVVAGDTVIVMSGYRNPNLMAIRLGRSGDLTDTDAIVYTHQRGNSYTPSPVLHDGKLYFITDTGMLTCLDAATGKPYYQQQRLPKPYNFKASPVAAGGNLYLATEEGDVVVVKLGAPFEVLATNTLEGQFFVASPVVVDNTLFLRSQEAVFCIRAR